MLFTSLHWALFLVLVFFVFQWMPGAGRRWLMLAASVYFYASWSVPYLALIAAQLVVDWTCGQLLRSTEDSRKRKLIVALSVVANLSALCTFKYLGLFTQSLRALGASVPLLQPALPLAISFYTFESMSYTIDIYRRRLEPVRSPLHLALFVTWFPHLIAGPIIRPAELVRQLDRLTPTTRERFFGGLSLMTVGYAKKLLLADWLARVADPIFASPMQYTSLELLVGVYAYAFQIYFDFSAYTDIARGASRWFGIELPENFNAPYLATSITDFWRRWHMTLSHWLRDYLYIPLGGNRKRPWRTYFNLFLTMLLGGLWHGAAWTFVAWGGLHGLYLAFERAFGIGIHDVRAGAPKVARQIVSFHLVCMGWILFRAQSFESAAQILRGIAAGHAHLTPKMVVPTLGCALLLAAYWSVARWRHPFLALDPGHSPVRQAGYAVVVGLCALLLMVLGASSNAFIYFQF